MKRDEKNFPQKGKSQEAILSRMLELKEQDTQWRNGRAFSMVYYINEEAHTLMLEAYKMYMSENALNPGAFRSIKQMEKELVSYVASLMGDPEIIKGSFTSGGTESILLAVKSARDYAFSKRPGIKPEMVIPVSAHPAFDKAAHYFGIQVHHARVNENYEADVEHIRSLINPNTILLVGSAPSYPHGIIDPIAELSGLALEKNVWLHVDACVGGMVLPFMEMLEHSVPAFDFRLEGVCSMSVDLHKYGYVMKGASVVLYKDKVHKRHQYFAHGGWSGGLYGSPGVLGTRSGGNVAAAWALMNYLGAEGYKNITQTVVQTTHALKKGIEQLPELSIIGNPQTTVLAFGSETIDIYEVADELAAKGWLFDRGQNPPSIHLTVNFIHKDYVQEFLLDLQHAVQKTKQFKVSQVTNNLLKNVTKTAVKILPEKMMSKITQTFTKFSQKNGELPSKTAPMYGMIAQLNNQKDLQNMIIDILEQMDE